MEWNNGRITKRPEELLAFHHRKLGELTLKGWDGRRPAYHQERIEYLSRVVGENVILVDFRGGNEAA